MRQVKMQERFAERTLIIDSYFNEVGKGVRISIEREVELAQMIRKGDTQALKELVSANLRFVISIAKQMNSKLPLPDLIQEGNVGIIIAALKFDETRGFKFISYAVWWIRQSIMKFISENESVVRLPSNIYTIRNKALREMTRVEIEGGIQLTLEEAAAELGLPTANLRSAANCWQPIRLDAPISESSEVTPLDLIKAESQPEFEPEKRNLLLDALRRALTHDEYFIITRFFGFAGDEMTIDNISMLVEKSVERTRQIKEGALRKLRRRPELFKMFV